MTSTFPGGFGPQDIAGGVGKGIFEVLEQFRAGFDRKPAPRMGRGDVRAAVLALLLEGPKHGYQIIQEIAERSGGAWKPSAGSVYPTLQLLNDEGLIVSEESDGRKTYALTEAGRDEAAEAADKPAPWQTSASRASDRHTALPKAGVELAQVVANVARTGTPEQIDEAVALLDGVRRQLHAILARG